MYVFMASTIFNIRFSSIRQREADFKVKTFSGKLFTKSVVCGDEVSPGRCGDTSVRTGSSSGTRAGWAGVSVRRPTSPRAVTGTGRYIQHLHWSSSYNTALSLVERFRVVKYFHALKGHTIGGLSDARPALLCHKEPAQGTQSPLLGVLGRNTPRGVFLAIRWFFMA